MELPVRTYEAMVIANPQLSDEALEQLKGQLSEVVKRQGGRVLETTLLGRRRLSFPIRKEAEGTYLQVRLEVASGEVVKIQRAVALIESVLRMMVIRPGERSQPAHSEAAARGKPPSLEDRKGAPVPADS